MKSPAMRSSIRTGWSFRGAEFNPISEMGSTPAPGVADRALADSHWRVTLAQTFETFPCARIFPRGRGKLRPGRARSPFHFGVRA